MKYNKVWVFSSWRNGEKHLGKEYADKFLNFLRDHNLGIESKISNVSTWESHRSNGENIKEMQEYNVGIYLYKASERVTGTNHRKRLVIGKGVASTIGTLDYTILVSYDEYESHAIDGIVKYYHLHEFDNPSNKEYRFIDLLDKGSIPCPTDKILFEELRGIISRGVYGSQYSPDPMISIESTSKQLIKFKIR